MSMIEKCARALWNEGLGEEGIRWDELPEVAKTEPRAQVRAVLSVLMEADWTHISVTTEDGSKTVNFNQSAGNQLWQAMIRHILNEETDGRLPSGRAGGADAPQPAPRSSPDGRSSLTQEGEA